VSEFRVDLWLTLEELLDYRAAAAVAPPGSRAPTSISDIVRAELGLAPIPGDGSRVEQNERRKLELVPSAARPWRRR
jgi:hypothetical protein